jgi:cytochrome c553
MCQQCDEQWERSKATECTVCHVQQGERHLASCSQRNPITDLVNELLAKELQEAMDHLQDVMERVERYAKP